MSSMEKIDLEGSLNMLLRLVTVFGVYKILALLFLIITGSVAQVAGSGSIAVPTVINTTINSTINSIASGYNLINAGDIIILGLIGLVVILKLFWPLIGGYIKAKKKKSGGSFN